VSQREAEKKRLGAAGNSRGIPFHHGGEGFGVAAEWSRGHP
jgi:hypothetical protein